MRRSGEAAGSAQFDSLEAVMGTALPDGYADELKRLIGDEHAAAVCEELERRKVHGAEHNPVLTIAQRMEELAPIRVTEDPSTGEVTMDFRKDLDSTQ